MGRAEVQIFGKAIVPLTLLAVALSIACVTESEPTEIRIRNVSGFDYDGLQVGDETYGRLPAGAETRYRDFGTAYRYNYVRLEIEGDEMILQPVDYVGETPLGPGRFTYEVSVIDRAAGQLEIDVVED